MIPATLQGRWDCLMSHAILWIMCVIGLRCLKILFAKKRIVVDLELL